jgi:integrase
MMAGHIRRRGRRSWEIKFDLGTDPLTGKRKTRYHSFKGTKKDAEIELARLLSGAAAGTYVDPTRETVSEFLERWERDWASHNLSPKTLERASELLADKVRPRIGAVRLQKLKPAHCAELYAKLLKEGAVNGGGLAARTVGQVHRFLHRAFGHAVKWGVIATNPCAAVEPPAITTKEIEILTEDQVTDVLNKLKGRPMYMLAAVGLSTGLRRGELLALRWKDVNLDTGVLQVERSLEQTKAGLRFKEPKTKHGRRQVAMPASVVAGLKHLRRDQQESRLALGLGKDAPDGLVFRRDDGRPMRPDNVSSEWRRLVAVLKLPKVTLHAWRHTHASQLIRANHDVLTISRRLGHGSPSITLNVYGHLFKGGDALAANSLDPVFSKAMKE